MTPWIIGTIVVLLGVAALKFALLRRSATTHPDGKPEPQPITNRRAIEWSVGLAALSVMTVGYTDISLWYLPVIAYAAIWLPIVRRKSATPRQSLLVSAVFTVSMITAVALRLLVWAD